MDACTSCSFSGYLLCSSCSLESILDLDNNICVPNPALGYRADVAFSPPLPLWALLAIVAAGVLFLGVLIAAVAWCFRRPPSNTVEGEGMLEAGKPHASADRGSNDSVRRFDPMYIRCVASAS